MSRAAAAITTPVTRLVPVDKNVLHEIITRHVVSIRLVNCGTVDVPSWQGEYFSFDFPLVANTNNEPDKKVLNSLNAALLERVAKGPSEPRRLSPQQLQDVHARLKTGEPRDRIADAYGVDVDTIKQLAAQ